MPIRLDEAAPVRGGTVNGSGRQFPELLPVDLVFLDQPLKRPAFLARFARGLGKISTVSIKQVDQIGPLELLQYRLFRIFPRGLW